MTFVAHRIIVHIVIVQYSVRNIEKVYYVEGPSAVQSRLCGWIYLIKFLIRNLSYSPSSEPSRTVLLLDIMYTMYARHPP